MTGFTATVTVAGGNCYGPSLKLELYSLGLWLEVEAGNQAETLDFVPDGHPELTFRLNSEIRLKVGEREQPFPRVGLLGQLSQRSFTTLQPFDKIVFCGKPR